VSVGLIAVLPLREGRAVPSLGHSRGLLRSLHFKSCSGLQITCPPALDCRSPASTDEQPNARASLAARGQKANLSIRPEFTRRRRLSGPDDANRASPSGATHRQRHITMARSDRGKDSPSSRPFDVDINRIESAPGGRRKGAMRG